MTAHTSFANRSASLRTLVCAFLCAAATASFAGEGHDHGDGSPVAQGTASPRLQAHSDLFELVGIVDKGQMTVYLDRYATNEPVVDATIEYESGANKGTATRQADGTYLIKFDALSKPGELPFSFTVAAGADTDLLAGDLDLHDPHAHEEEVGRPWLRWLGFAFAAAGALALAALLTRKFRYTRRGRVNG